MKRLLVVLGSLGATSLIVLAVFALGSWGYQHRSLSLHYGRLQRLVEQKPTLRQVTQGLLDEGARLVDSSAGEADLRRLAARWGGPHAAEVVSKGTRWAHTRVFLARDVVYILYFDSEGTLRDFTLAPG